MKRYFLCFLAGLGMVLGCRQPDLEKSMHQIYESNHAIVSITIKRMPAKTVYEIGETEYDLTGINVVGERSSGEPVELNLENLEIEGFSTTSLGRKTFYLVSHEGVSGNPVRTKIRFIVVKPDGTRGQWGVTQFEAEPFSINGMTVESSGAAIANVSRANTGVPVEVLIDPENGFTFVEGSLRYRNANDAEAPEVPIPNNAGVYAFMMPAYNIVLRADFDRIEYRVSASPALRAGTLAVKNMETPVPAGQSAAAKLGDKIQVTVQGAYAASFNADSLTYTYFDTELGKETGPRIGEDSGLEDIAGGYFLMPAGNTSLFGSYVSGGGLVAIDFHTPVETKWYDVGAPELDFAGFTFTKIYSDGSTEIVRCSAANPVQWESSLDGGEVWAPFEFIDPNQYFSGFDGKQPFDSTRLGEQPVQLAIEGKTALFMVGVDNEADLAAAYRIDRSNGGFIRRYYRTLQEAVAAACPLGVGIDWDVNNQEEIKLLKDMGINGNHGSGVSSPAMYLTAGKHIEIRGGDTTAVTISRTASGFAELFRVDEGSLSLSGKLTLDGGSGTGKTATHPLVAMFDGYFMMKGNDVRLQNNNDTVFDNTTTAARAGGVLVLEGRFTMEGGAITNTRSVVNSSSVVVTSALGQSGSGNGIFNMLGGMIESPEAPDTHYGVYVSDLSTFTMSGSATVHIKNPIYLSSAAPSRKIGIAGNLTPQNYQYNGVTISGITARLSELSANTQYLSGDSYIPANRHFFRPHIFGPDGKPQARFLGGTIIFYPAPAIYDDTGIEGMNAIETHRFMGTIDSPVTTNFTVSSQIDGVSLLLQGGGGGGGGGGSQYGGNGGSAGAIVRIDNQPLLAGDYVVTVGTGGTGGPKNELGQASTQGSPGGDTSIALGGNTLYTAQGGAGGAVKNSGSYGGNGGDGYTAASPDMPSLGIVATTAAGAAGGGSSTAITLYSSNNYYANGGGGGPGTTSTAGGSAHTGAGPGATQLYMNDANRYGCGGGGGAGHGISGSRIQGGNGRQGCVIIEFIVYP